MHHGDTPSIILQKEKEQERGEAVEKKKGGGESGRERPSVEEDRERRKEGELSHECCVWSSFMVVRLNSRSRERESFRNGALGSDQISRRFPARR